MNQQVSAILARLDRISDDQKSAGTVKEPNNRAGGDLRSREGEPECIQVLEIQQNDPSAHTSRPTRRIRIRSDRRAATARLKTFLVGTVGVAVWQSVCHSWALPFVVR